jgi:hypothetical protein
MASFSPGCGDAPDFAFGLVLRKVQPQEVGGEVADMVRQMPRSEVRAADLLRSDQHRRFAECTGERQQGARPVHLIQAGMQRIHPA